MARLSNLRNSSTRWFDALPDKVREDIEASSTIMKASEGQVVVRQGDDVRGLYGVVTGELQAIGTTPHSVPIRLRVASWYDVKLDQAQHAGTHYQWVLQIEPDNIGALSALVELLERYQNWPKVVEFLRRLVDLQVEPEERKASLEKLAGILESRLDRADEAIDAWRMVTLDNPDDLPALEALERLYAMRQRWQELI